MEKKVESISIFGNRKLQNYCKKNGIKIELITELVNTYGKHYANKLVDRRISIEDYNRCPSFTFIDVRKKIDEHFKSEYPHITDTTIAEVCWRYQEKNNRSLSINIIKRSYALLVAHFRHNYTDYDGSFNSENHDVRKSECNKIAHKMVAELRKKDKH